MLLYITVGEEKFEREKFKEKDKQKRREKKRREILKRNLNKIVEKYINYRLYLLDEGKCV